MGERQTIAGRLFAFFAFHHSDEMLRPLLEGKPSCVLFI
ncbi:hypothetical protein R2A130_2908 [Ahrensia sp. R2A130]|nr:hypothetical protein R2A130_2908 [Ahrensia sp. R2A130]